MKASRAMFYCGSVVPAAYGYDTVAHLTACTGGSDEKDSFNTATPCGSLTIQISKDAPAHKFFKAGRDYYLDFTLVPLKKN